MPAMSTEAWVVAALFPSDVFMNGVPECFGSPEGRLSQQRKTQRIRKSRGDYQAKSAKIEESWHRLVASGRFGEASRFQKELLEQVNRFAAP
jgi:hypothetical protein